MKEITKATTTCHQTAQWSLFFEFSREQFISYWLKYLIDHQSNLDFIEAEENNIKSAWAYATKQQNEVDLMQAMEPFYQFYRTRGRINEGQTLFANTLSLYTNEDDDYSNFTPSAQKLIGRLLTHQAWFCQNLGQYALSEKLIQQASPLLYKFNDTKYIASLLSIKGTIHRYGYGDVHKAKELYYRGFNLYQAVDDHWGMANTLNNLGIANNDLGEYQIAVQLFEKATTICKQNNHRDLLARSISNLGVAYEGLGDLSKALETYKACFDVCQQLQNKLGMAISLANQTQIALRQEQFIKSKFLCLQQLELSREIDNKYLQVGGLADLGNAYYMLAEYNLAWEALQQGLDIATTIHSKPATIQILGQYARLFYHVGKPTIAFMLLTIIYPVPFSHRHLGSPENLYEILVSELPVETISTLQGEWQDKTLDDAIYAIERIFERELSKLH